MTTTAGHDLAWTKATLDPSDVRVSLPEGARAELIRQRALLTGLPTTDAFPALSGAIEAVRSGMIEARPGFCIVDGAAFAELTPQEKRGVFRLVAGCLGTLRRQNANGDTLVEVFDRGTSSMATGGRYHQTNASGVLHTDSPQWLEAPDYVALLCARPAKSGGESKFISAYAVHDRLQAQTPELLQTLSEPFYFDKRGDFAAGEAPFTVAPVFRYDAGRLSFRYLRDYIDSGQRLADRDLTSRQVEALDTLDEVLRDESLVVEATMHADDLQVLNNSFVVHDRRPFEDHAEVERRRMMLRAWIRRPA